MKPPRPAPPSSPATDPDVEFGVRVPGKVLPEDQWARTAIKKLPPPGPLDFAAIFGRTAPIVLDLGCGNGRSTLCSAIARPDHDHVASDILPVVIRYGTRRANQRGLSNVRFAVIGGREFLEQYVAPGTIAEIDCYHPQPYYERREIFKRLITPEFLALVHRCLIPGGTLILQTDNPTYWRYMKEVVPAFFELTEHLAPWPDAPKGRTRREILALREKLPVFRAVCRARTDLTEADLDRLAQELPFPKFNADRKLARLDQLEREGSDKPRQSRPPRR
ncbi:MAG TPA: methyltransferase domain-containing protein [Planctomycetaceae bacterium]|nr:methyltransferase domain-containing protein [Planctomycetaceae bacterium]